LNRQQGPGFPASILWVLVALTLGWGFNWPMMKLALTEMAPMHFRTWCLAAGVLGLFAIALANGLSMRVPAGQWGRLTAIALANMTCWNVFAIYGIPLLPSGRAAILGYTMPVWSVPLSVWLLKEPLTGRRVLGMALGIFLAVLVTQALKDEGVIFSVPVGNLVVFAGD